jgi:hypothetical protein
VTSPSQGLSSNKREGPGNEVGLKTVKKWEENLSCDLEKEINCGKVTKLKYKVCCKYENRITSIKGQ